MRVRANVPIRQRGRGIVRSAALRRSALSLLKDISIGFRSGEYLGRQRSVAPRASIASRAPTALWGKVVDHDDILGSERRGETLFDIGQEFLSSHGAVDCLRRQGDCLPVPLRPMADQPLAARATAIQPHRLGVGSRVDQRPTVRIPGWDSNSGQRSTLVSAGYWSGLYSCP